MPWQTHPTLAVTGSQCLTACALAPNTVADGMMTLPSERPALIKLHHAMGKLDVLVDFEIQPDGTFIHHSAGVRRTARKLASGEVFAARPKEN